MVLAPKKSVAIQARRWSSGDVAHISRWSGAGVTTSSVGQASLVVVPVPSAGQVDVGAQSTPLEVTKESATEVVRLPTMDRSELSTALVVLTLVGAM